MSLKIYHKTVAKEYCIIHLRRKRQLHLANKTLDFTKLHIKANIEDNERNCCYYLPSSSDVSFF